MYCVRNASPEDFAEMARKGRAFWEQTEYCEAIPYSEESVVRSLHAMADQRLLLLAECDGEIIGFIGGLAAPAYTNHDYRIGQELFWYVDPGHRRGGVAMRLLRSIEGAAKEAGCAYWTMIALESVDPDRAEAIYCSAGYTRTERGFSKRLE